MCINFALTLYDFVTQPSDASVLYCDSSHIVSALDTGLLWTVMVSCLHFLLQAKFSMLLLVGTQITYPHFFS